MQIRDVARKPLRPFIESIGTLNPYEEVSISAEVEGILKTVKVDEGTVVSRGMLLAAIDDVDYALEVKRAEAALRQTQATLENTKLEFRRKDALYKEELVTKQQYDDVTTRLALAEAEVERAKAALSLARVKLSKTRIHSPIACVVKEKKISAGDFVKNGTSLFVIIQPNPLKLRFTVPEKDVAKLKIKQDVLLKVDGLPGSEFKGKVNIIFPHVEERTRTLMVEALVPNDSGILKPGLFAKVILYTGDERDTIVVPVTALLYEAETVKVFTVEGDRARERLVKLGSKYGELMEITEGLKEGEKVVTAGQQNLSEGVKLSVQPAVPENPTPGKQQATSENMNQKPEAPGAEQNEKPSKGR
ncbi:MAG: Multidrug resistance protein MdtA precursor [Syntrophorhabdus sp. PtaU1.Bin002]|nr:MAG: Multidrug resistance protein MdtA precursor [Syntrophorhabdus sp. PtaU1.Bin002]